MTTKRIQFLLEGRVTSVKMRRYVENVALNLNLKGYVMNTANGNVYGEASGNDDSIDWFSTWIHGNWLPKKYENVKSVTNGSFAYPKLARVDCAKVLPSDNISNLKDFCMIRDPTVALALEDMIPKNWEHAKESRWIPPVIMAPMVRGSELAYRMLGRKYGCSSAYSPMIGAEGILSGNASHRLISCSGDRPLIVQLMGNQPKQVAAAAIKIVQELNGQVDGIDFNLGCPQEVADKGNFGAFLATRDPNTAIECIRELSKAMNTIKICNSDSSGSSNSSNINNSTSASVSIGNRSPRVSTKIRLFQDVEDTINFAKKLQSAGCELLAVHCRRAGEKHNGEPDYAAGALLVEALDIPVVINGGIYDGNKAIDVVRQTNCHAVMVAQGLLENHRMLVEQNVCPSILAAEYLESCVKYPPPNPLYIRKHLRWIFRKQLQPKKTTNLADYKKQFTDWRPKLWTFLVRPYLTDMIQFQQVVNMYCNLAKIDVPESLLKLNLPTPSFKSIRHIRDNVSASTMEGTSSTRKRKSDEM
jgi:tRNA-dihydrouridine synthase/acylphosphatase